jgi:hypothetical protein
MALDFRRIDSGHDRCSWFCRTIAYAVIRADINIIFKRINTASVYCTVQQPAGGWFHRTGWL